MFNSLVKNSSRKRKQRRKQQRRRPIQRRLLLEALEARVVPASITRPGGINGVIEVLGDSDNELITINDIGSEIEVIVQNQDNADDRIRESFTKEAPGLGFADLARLNVQGRSGNDRIVNNTSLPMTANGDHGDDTLIGGLGNDTLIGGQISFDHLFGRDGDDVLYGDMVVPRPGHNTEGIGEADILYGGSGVDEIWGAGGDDVLQGEDGNDFLFGGWGDDIVDGGYGHDKVSGGLDDDTLYGAMGNDELNGEDGVDLLYGHEGNDALFGHNENDFLDGGQGDDDLDGGDSDDELHGGRGADTVTGGPGNDTLYGGLMGDETDGDDFVTGFAGDDLVYGSGGNDTVFGGFGNDTVFGDEGNDRIFGDDDNDALHGGEGNDFLGGGSGADQLHGDAGSDTLAGSNGNDALHGGLPGEADGDDLLYGDGTEGSPALFPGNDTLAGYAGNDILFGGPGRDKLYGNRPIKYDPDSNDGNDRLFGEEDDDESYGHAGDDLLKDSALGNNVLDGGPGIDEIVFTFGMGLLHAEILDNNGEHVTDGPLPNNGNLLSLAGTDEDFPDSGFTLEAANGWTKSEQSSGSESIFTYTADGAVTIKSGDLPDLPIGFNLTVSTLPSPDERRAVVDTSSLSFTFDVATWINDNLSQDFGIDFNFPSLSAGIKSGGDLRMMDDSYPLRENQPYLFAEFDTNTVGKFGGVSIAPATGATDIALIIDPTDPLVYFKNGSIAAGMSLNGRAQFHPNVELEGFSDKDDVIYGHIFLGLNGIPLPSGFSLNGGAVVDFDANDDGNELDGAAGSPSTWFDTDAFLDAIDDVSLGINGDLFFGPNFKTGFFKFLDVSIKVGQGALVLDGDQEEIHLRGKTVNPFDDTPLEDWAVLRNELDISGSLTGIDGDNTQFRFDAEYKNNAANQSVEFHADNDGAVLFGTMDLYGQRAFARGEITSDGRILLFAHAHAEADIDLGPANFDMGVTFDLSVNGNLQYPSLAISGSVEAYANVLSNNGDYGLAGKVSAELDAGLSGAGSVWVRAEVSGSLTVKLDFIDFSFDISAAAEISNEGLKIRVNNTWYTIVWSSSRVFSTRDNSSNEEAVIPGGETMDRTPTLEWSEVEDAVAYELWVNNVSTGQSRVIHQTNLTGLSHEHTSTLPFGEYRVWTRSHFADNTTGSWSDPYDFHIVRMLTPEFAPFNRDTTDATPELPWFSVPGASRYELWVNNLTTGESRVIHQPNLTAVTHIPANDLPVGKYRAWVRAHGNSVSSKWSDPQDFKISETIVAPQPTLLADVLTQVRPHLSWSHAPGAARYELWVNNVTTGESRFIHETNLTATRFTPSAALPAGTYRMWVRAFDFNGQASDWSSAHDFTIAAPAAPEWFGPHSETTDTTPEFIWHKIDGAVQYELWVNNDTTGQSRIIHETDLTDSHYTDAAALPVGSYTAWVRARNTENGSVGPWSDPHRFEIVNLLTPVLDALPSSTTDTKPTISWSAVENAVRYELWVNNVTTSQNRVIHQTNLTATSFTPPQHLSLGTHRVWVRAFDASGAASNWSQAKDFAIVAPPAPQISEPAGNTTDTTPTFQWNSVSGAAKYELWINNVSTGQSRVIHETDLTATTHTPAKHLSLGTHRVWVRALNSTGQAGDWSRAQDFTIVAVAAPQISEPAGSTADTTPTFQWNSVSGAAKYELWVNNVTTSQSRVIHETSLTSTDFTPTQALSIGAYDVWVRAFNAGGDAGPWSQRHRFSITALPTLPAPNLNGPKGTVSSIRPTFSWESVQGANHYELQVDNLTSGQSNVIHETDLPGNFNSYSPQKDLLFNNMYRFRMRTYNANDEAGPWSGWLEFEVS